MAKMILKVLALSIFLSTGIRPCDRYIDIDRYKTDLEYYLMMSEWGGLTQLKQQDAYSLINRYQRFFSTLCSGCKGFCKKQCKGALRRLKSHLRDKINNNVFYM